MMQTPPFPKPNRVFPALDGLRGVAAVFVAMRHTFFFHNLGVHGGYMAVDLFFALSGFVIAHAYEARFEAGLTARRFLILRYLRLWPVYVLGAILGLVAGLVHALSPRDALTAAQVAQTTPFALAMLPGPPIKPMLYPVDAVAWSLALELIANLAFALAWRPLRRPAVLAATLAGSGLALIATVLAFGTLDIGFEWRNAIGGLPRVVFAFTAGLAAYRLYQRGCGLRAAPAWAWVAILPALFLIELDQVVWPLACALVFFPAIVFCAAIGPQPGPRSSRLFLALGALSYPLYAIHKPLGSIMVLAVHDFAPHLLTNWPAQTGVAYMLALAGGCLLLERYYDRPVRGWLSGLTRGGRIKPFPLDGGRVGMGAFPPAGEG